MPYQSTHNTGGVVMGTDPSTSAVNKYLQSWDVPNVFVVGASAFPQNGGYNPTGTVGALTFHALEAIKTRYLKEAGGVDVARRGIIDARRWPRRRRPIPSPSHGLQVNGRSLSVQLAAHVV